MLTKGSIENLLLSEDEQNQQLSEWNNTVTSYPLGDCMHVLFSQSVVQAPNQVALRMERGKSYTYQEIDKLSDHVANFLMNKLRPSSLIAVLLQPSLEFVVNVLGILKAGCTYLPIETKSSEERLKFILTDCKASALITTKTLKEKYSQFINQTFTFEDYQNVVYTEIPTTNNAAEQIAYVRYSLTEKKSKAIAFSHRSLVNAIHARSLLFPVLNKIALLHSVESDLTITSLFWAFYLCGTVVIPECLNPWDIESTLSLIEQEAITHLLYCPGPYDALLEQAKGELKSLEVVSLSGETIFPNLLEKHLKSASHTSLYNEYKVPGIFSLASVTKLYDKNNKEHQEITLGRPIANTHIYLFNEKKEFVPVGVKAEIYVGGLGLGSDLNSAIEDDFVKHPFLPSEKLYRTGDIACYLEGGFIEYITSRDRQVKHLEQQVDQVEIENILREHSSVADAVVMLSTGQNGVKRLVAYIVWAEKTDPDSELEILKSCLHKQLPSYKIPQIFMSVGSFEFTLSGKRDISTLPVPLQENRGDGFKKPHTEIEKCLAGIWSE
ncbi:MAG TPA: AMP-binding protein, partial [Gammaproteobacteria bacterium]|nr:AMP-binding protein [Gammaproteobacteria bacterium]